MIATSDRHRPVRWLAVLLVSVLLTGCASSPTARSPIVAPPPSPEQPVDATATPSPSPSAPPSPSSSPSPTGEPLPDVEAVDVTLTEVAQLDAPIDLAVRPGDDALWIAERGGTVRAVRGGVVDPAPLIDLSGDISTDGERGLLGITFSPDGGRLYAYFTGREGDIRVDEWVMDSAGGPAGNRRMLVSQPHPRSNHNGGTVTFGPDGLLYLGIGDGGGQGDPAGNGQALDTVLGKIVRIDPAPSNGFNYTVPPDNPFVGREGARPEIWAYGLRNPWRWSFDRATGDVWIGDVGERQVEEVNVVPFAEAPGANFGWSLFEGSLPFAAPASATPEGVVPIAEYSHDEGCSVTGGYVYRGEAIPDLRGAYVFGDFCQGRVQAIVASEGALYASADLGVQVDSLVSFGEDATGELYALSLDGGVYRLDPAPG